MPLSLSNRRLITCPSKLSGRCGVRRLLLNWNRSFDGQKHGKVFCAIGLKNTKILSLLFYDTAKKQDQNDSTNRRGAHGRRSRVLDQNMRRTDSTRRAGGGQRVASFCSSAAAFLSPCAVMAASATSRDRASTPISATLRAAYRHLRSCASPIAEISKSPSTPTKGGPPQNPNSKRFQLNATQADSNLDYQKTHQKIGGLN
ncbi:hypothetical protein DM40_3729 [Burkholderia cenocepacia]|nr:hypothetical protein DM40_3729 [Burkholderia cenocepacia]